MSTNQNKYHISAEMFADLYKNGNWDNRIEIIDVREPEEWEIYHLEKTKPIPIGTLPNRLEELDRHKKIYVMCAHGIRSLHAVNFLLHQGFTDVINVDGGLAEVSLYLDSETDRES